MVGQISDARRHATIFRDELPVHSVYSIPVWNDVGKMKQMLGGCHKLPLFFLFWRSLNLGWTPRNSNVREGQSCDGGDLISTTEVMRGCVCMESALWHVFAVLFLISFLFYFVIELYLSVFRC